MIVVNINNKYIHEDKVNTSWRFPVLLLDDNIVYTRFMKALPRKRHIHESFHASFDFFLSHINSIRKASQLGDFCFTIIFCAYQKSI